MPGHKCKGIKEMHAEEMLVSVLVFGPFALAPVATTQQCIFFCTCFRLTSSRNFLFLSLWCSCHYEHTS